MYATTISSNNPLSRFDVAMSLYVRSNTKSLENILKWMQVDNHRDKNESYSICLMYCIQLPRCHMYMIMYSACTSFVDTCINISSKTTLNLDKKHDSIVNMHVDKSALIKFVAV